MRLELDVGPVAHGGHCVARHEGRVVFVRHALPGEKVRVEVTDDGDDARFWRADAVDVIEASPHRVDPRCPAAGPGRCGGCDWQHVELTEQRRLKAAVVAEQLTRLAGLHVAADDIVVEPVPGDDEGLEWRTRVRLAVDADGRAGLRRHRSHDVVVVDDCPLAHPDLDLAHVLARRWPPGAEVLVTGGDGRAPTVQVAPTAERAPVQHVSGPVRRRETADGRRWAVTGSGFWQVHPGAADALVGAVREALCPRVGESVLDLYSGVGLFAGALAGDVGPSGRVVAVESAGQAVADARRNVHDLTWVRLEHQRVDRYLRQQSAGSSVDLVVLDPPRTGAGTGVCRAIAQRRPRRIAYVACDPAALARDLRTFVDVGYEVSRLRAFDLFPMTHHVECVVTLRPSDAQGRMVADADGSAYSQKYLDVKINRETGDSVDSFGSHGTLRVGETDYTIARLSAVGDVSRLPFSLKVLLENLLRTEDGANITADDISALVDWDPTAEPSTEIQFTPARVIMQDFTGVPAVVDLATMREAVAELGGDPSSVNPLAPAELVIDHSVIADLFGTPNAFERNVDLEYERNKERYQFLRWGQGAFDEFKVVPPGTGIVHQVNIEHLARVTMVRERDGVTWAYPDTCVGTDSHTTMVNGIGVVGWGVGGIEAEAAMLGQPVSMLIPRVVGFKLSGELPDGATATDLVLTVTEMLRQHGVVGKFVEFYGPGVGAVPLANRATIGNMSPEYGSTIAVFPIDDETTRYMRLTGRSEEQVALVEAYAREQGLWHDPDREPAYSEYLELDLSTVVPSLAGPKRPQDRIELSSAAAAFAAAVLDFVSHDSADPESALDEGVAESFPASDPVAVDEAEPAAALPHHTAVVMPHERPSKPTPVTMDDGTQFVLDHGAVVIAAITSCTNTSNPSVMIGAALLAKKAVERGLARRPWVKTTLAPGSKVVMDYYDRAGLTPYLEKLGFHLVGYGCTTCIGNSGPLPPEISAAVNEADLAVTSVLSGNRNFEGRINPDVKMNYLASPPLVVAYALAGSMALDITTEPLGTGSNGEPVYLRDIWPSPAEIQEVIDSSIASEMFTRGYADVFAGDERWQTLPTPTGQTFAWDEASTYVRKAPYFDGMGAEPEPVTDIAGARVLARLGDSVTTDHISPAGAIKADSPAGEYLRAHGVERRDFNSYGSRRGNHEVMIRGTFANIRLRNQIAPGTEGGFTRDFTQGSSAAQAPVTTIYDASVAYAEAGVPLVVLAGKEYGSGSSRDWAAKGTALLGVRAVIAESYERIHRSNLIGMGVLPLQFPAGENADSLGLTGEETFAISGVTALNEGTTPATVSVVATAEDGTTTEFDAVVRIDTPGEADYYRNGGIMPYVLRQLSAS